MSTTAGAGPASPEEFRFVKEDTGFRIYQAETNKKTLWQAAPDGEQQVVTAKLDTAYQGNSEMWDFYREILTEAERAQRKLDAKELEDEGKASRCNPDSRILIHHNIQYAHKGECYLLNQNKYGWRWPGSCMHAKGTKEDPAWLKVKFDEEYTITKVSIDNRGDSCCSGWANGNQLFIDKK